MLPNSGNWAVNLATSVRIDPIDWQIIAHLQRDGRLTIQDLAQRVGLSSSPCLRRLRKLEDAKVITGYRATVDPAFMERAFQVFVYVSLEPENRDTILAFERAVEEIESVVEAHRMFGEPDYVLRVAVRDNAAYEDLYTNQLSNLPGVVNLTSQIAMKTIKQDEPIPIVRPVDRKDGRRPRP